MADIQELRKYLDDLKSGMDSINDLTLEMEEQSKNLVANLASFAGIGTKGGIIRSIITRATTGTGLFNLTQRLTSTLLVFKFIQKTQEERLKEEREFNKLMENREKIMRRLSKMKDDDLTFLEKERFYNDSTIRMKLKTLSLEEAIAESRGQLGRATSKLRRAGRIALRGKGSRLLALDKVGRGVNTMRMGASDAAFLTMSENELGAMSERMRGLSSEEETIRKQLGVAEDAYDAAATGTAAKKRAEQEMNILRDSLSLIEETRKDVQEDMNRLSSEFLEDIKEIKKRTGMETNIQLTGNPDTMSEEEMMQRTLENGDELITGFEQLSFIQQIQFKYQKAKDKAQERLDKIKGFFKTDDFKIIKSFLLKGLMVFSGLILGMSALVGLIFILYYLGIGEWLMTVGKAIGASFEIFSEFLDRFKGSFMMLFEGLWEVITGFVGVIYGMFTGDGDLIGESTGKFFMGIGKVLLGVGGVLLGGVLTAVQALVVGGISMVLGGIANIFSKVEGFGGFVGSIAGSGLGMVGGAKVGAMIGTAVLPGVGTTVGGIIGGIGGAVAGGNLGVKLGNMIGFADGGTTPHSGTFLVGERGPELVSLPGNSRVFNNTDTSRMMSPTININVTGRVGASDTELNDIARKIGQKINIEMNRYNSSGLRG